MGIEKKQPVKKRAMTHPQRFHLEKYRDGKPKNEGAHTVPLRVYDSLKKHGYIRRSGYLLSSLTVKGALAMQQKRKWPVIPDGVNGMDFALDHPEILRPDAPGRTGV